MNIIEHLTREQMTEKYPNTWLGLTNVIYTNDDGVTLESADIVYTNKSRDELSRLQVIEGEDIIDWYTNDNGLPLGMAGIFMTNKSDYIGKRLTWSQAVELFPDLWVSLKIANFRAQHLLKASWLM